VSFSCPSTMVPLRTALAHCAPYFILLFGSLQSLHRRPHNRGFLQFFHRYALSHITYKTLTMSLPTLSLLDVLARSVILSRLSCRIREPTAQGVETGSKEPVLGSMFETLSFCSLASVSLSKTVVGFASAHEFHVRDIGEIAVVLSSTTSLALFDTSIPFLEFCQFIFLNC
jgi:hypothetical protein